MFIFSFISSVRGFAPQTEIVGADIANCASLVILQGTVIPVEVYLLHP
jgi:hypothetical protein